MPKIALMAKIPDKANLIAGLVRQGYEILSVPIGMTNTLDLDVLITNDVMNKDTGRL